jgi:hypothetical protein
MTKWGQPQVQLLLPSQWTPRACCHKKCLLERGPGYLHWKSNHTILHSLHPWAGRLD